MNDWNVVITTRDGGYTKARQVMERYGPVEDTDFYNVLVQRVDDVPAMLDDLRARLVAQPDLKQAIARVSPVETPFEFQTREEFEAAVRERALSRLKELANRSFHVRLHRRGLKEQLPSVEEEKSLNEALLEALGQAGLAGRIVHDDPDVVVALETVGCRAGLALWTRTDHSRLPLLGVD